MKETINIHEAKTKELVEFYNKYADKPVKKFSSRAVAERRVAELMAGPKTKDEPTDDGPEIFTDERGLSKTDVQLKRTYGFTHCPHCGVHLENGVGEDGQEVNGEIIHHALRQFECLGCGGEFGPKVRHKKHSASRSEAIAKSWEVPETAIKRAQRSAVKVDDETYRSVRQAFVALGLPMKMHIAFRMELKEKGKVKAFDHSWKIVPLNYNKE